MGYTNQPLVEAMRGSALTESEVTLLALYSQLADEWIDDLVGITFTKQGVETKYYESRQGIIPIDPVREYYIPGEDEDDPPVLVQPSVSSVNGDDEPEEINSDNYRFMPLNKEVKTYIEIGANLSEYHWPGEPIPDFLPWENWTYGKIAITGEFSHSDAPPAAVVFLATYICCKYFARSIEGAITQRSLEGYSEQYAVYASKDGFFDEPAQKAIAKLQKTYNRIKV